MKKKNDLGYIGERGFLDRELDPTNIFYILLITLCFFLAVSSFIVAEFIPSWMQLMFAFAGVILLITFIVKKVRR